MQAANRSVRVPSADCSMLMKNFGKAASVFGQMGERHCAVLDETHRLTVAFH